MSRRQPYVIDRANRRIFLKGALGLTFALPLLDSVLDAGSSAVAQSSAGPPRFFVALRQGNGVQQAARSLIGREDPERFWPFELGALTPQALRRTDADGNMRAVGELADFASKLLIVRGTKYNYPGNGCGHSGGGNQCLTASPPTANPSRNRSLSEGESLDNLIQRSRNPADPEPLTLGSGVDSGYLGAVLSYRSGRDLREPEKNPWEVYKSLFGEPGQDNSALIEAQVAAQRKSVNDLVREELDYFLSQQSLSKVDRDKLELHRQSVRDTEVSMMECHLPEAGWQAARSVDADRSFNRDVGVEITSKLHGEIIALAFACNLKSAATLQIGNGNDGGKYPIGDGSEYNFHYISHRILDHGSDRSKGLIEGADLMHHRIDRFMGQMFRHLVAELDKYQMGGGTLLDQTVAMWTSDLAHGNHGYNNIPYVLAGSGGGYLRTGEFIDARDTGNADGNWVPHNQLFNTIANACGVRNDDGSPVEDFGHKGGMGHDQPNGGEIPGMKT